MKGAALSCCCHERNQRSGYAGPSRPLRESAAFCNPLPSPSKTLAGALAVHSLGAHEELLPWLYKIVDSIAPESSLPENYDDIQRRVASILRNLFVRMPSDQVKVLEAIELGNDSFEDTAHRLHLAEAETVELHIAARANFITLLSGHKETLSLASTC